MRVYDQEIRVPGPAPGRTGSLLEHFSRALAGSLAEDETPIRFVVTKSGEDGFDCEVGTLVGSGEVLAGARPSIFELRRRSHENRTPFGVALVIPAGIDCEIGGHSGDAGPVARLLGACCDHLVLHPNVVNASDLNELPENALYVEGSVLSRFLMGTVGLVPVRANRVLLVIDLPEDLTVAERYINTFSAARAAMGLQGPGVHCVRSTCVSRATYTRSGRASGTIEHLERLFGEIRQHEGEFDVLALASVIHLTDEMETAERYFSGGCVNPWGGVEALLTHAVSHVLNLPSAHAPLVEQRALRELNVGVCDPRKAAEASSLTDLFCILKGLQRSPRILTSYEDRQKKGVLNVEDISCLVQPVGCLGLPTLAALEQGITVVAVRDNRNLMDNDLAELPFRSDRLFVVDSYLEAAGLLCALRAGVDPSVLRRPMSFTRSWGFPSGWRGTRPAVPGGSDRQDPDRA